MNVTYGESLLAVTGLLSLGLAVASGSGSSTAGLVGWLGVGTAGGCVACRGLLERLFLFRFEVIESDVEGLSSNAKDTHFGDEEGVLALLVAPDGVVHGPEMVLEAADVPL